ncbi:nitrate- and nitrite sensing domain-containing protein [Actinoallomurus liliacearum]|uniref:nitrate- and nitrite sensing domain-containing protein n=1 Tax=Actinoallomurus liliacearum TaxID=1080073 RepID=UPI0031E50F31
MTHGLEAERDSVAMSVSAGQGLDDQNVRQAMQQVDAAVGAVRTAAGAIDASYPVRARDKVRDILNRLDKLPSLRQMTAKTKMPPDVTIDKYGQFISDLVDLDDVIALGSSDPDLAQDARALGALSRAKEESSRERAFLGAAMRAHRFLPSGFDGFQAARAQRDSELVSFESSATSVEGQLYADTVTGPQVDRAEFTRQQAVNRLQQSPDLSLRTFHDADAKQWYDDMTFRLDRMRVVEEAVVKGLVSKSRDLKEQAYRSAMIIAGLLLLVIIAVIIATVVVAQSLVRPLRKLRAGALEVAGSRLPDLVRRLRDPETDNDAIEIEPIDVHTTDEIGEVARSFDEVHREAVRLASNEALLRGNVNAMFVNLSRRSQSLIERQLRLIEDLEQSEQDSARLEALFKLDHLATRMRRNGENLLVLGGQEQTRRWNKPVALVDIVRASLSEVEQYERVTLRIQDDVSVVGRVVNDLVHLVAELVENSTTFSPEHTKVAVSGHLLSGGGAMLQISDNGVGMSPEELEEANWKLANPPTIDVSISRRMGLFVVGRLAQRHGIRVELRAALSGGLTAFVILPANAISSQGGNPPSPRRLDSPMETPARRELAAEAPVARGQLPRSVEPLSAAPVPDTPWEPSRNFNESVRGPVEPEPIEPEPLRRSMEPPREPVESPRAPAEPVWTPRETTRPSAEPVWTPRETPRPSAEPARNQMEPPEEPGTPLPKRRPANTAPPGRGAAPSAPGRSGPPAGAPPAGRPQRPQSAPYSSGRPPAPGSARGESRLGDENGGRSPIFEAMQSEWFQRRKTGSMARSESAPPPEWSSPADDGFRAAETVRAPSVGGKTAAGLPKRVPGNNRIPGSIASARPAPQPQQPVQPVQQPVQPPPRPAFQPPEAEAVRNRFSSFQQGVRRGRAAIRPEDDERENQ